MASRKVAVLCLAASLACAGDTANPPDAPGEIEQADAGARDDTLPARPHIPQSADSLRVLMDALEARLAVASEAERPALLLELGRLKRHFEPGSHTPHAEYARARPQEFFYNEVGSNYYYKGTAFREVIERYPDSGLADDAAYELTSLPRGGECEGFTACYIERHWTPLAAFLRAFPHSPFADSAVAHALSTFSENLEDIADLRTTTTFYWAAEVRPLVASLDSVARLLPPRVGARMLEEAGQLWERFAEYELARAAYEAALAGDDPAARARVEARIAALSGPSFSLAAPRVLSTSRTQLRWSAPPAGTSALTVYRTTTRADRGAALARLPGDARAWTDTTTAPGVSYWYRVVAESAAGTVASNPAGADVPTLRLGIFGIAVSESDGSLHVFGSLSNDFPQVLRVSADGKSVERSDGVSIGLEEMPGELHRYDEDVGDVWLVDGNAHGVLRFRKTGPGLPAELRAPIRHGRELLPNDLRDVPYGWVVSVDERGRSAWLETRSQPKNHYALDCAPALDLCWTVGDSDLALRRDDGAMIRSVPLPRDSAGDVMRARPIFADPKDGSAWLLLTFTGRLLNITRDGAVRHDLQLTARRQAYSLKLTADLERRAIWFTRTTAAGVQELLRIDVDAAAPQPQLVASGVPNTPWIAADLAGGVWFVALDEIRRMDTAGRTIVRVPTPWQR